MRNRSKGGLRGLAGLGDLPADRYRNFVRELNPDVGAVDDFENRNSFSVFPFVVGPAGTPIQVLPANSRRTYVLIQNQNPAGGFDCFVGFGRAPSGTGGVLIEPRGYYELIGGPAGGPMLTTASGGSAVPADSVWIGGNGQAVVGVVVEGVMLQPTR